jgi:hypothetical protein
MSFLKFAVGARGRRWSEPAATVLAGLAIGLTCVTVTLAQSEDKVKAGVTAWRNSGCSD